jgi:hypothetical protein
MSGEIEVFEPTRPARRCFATAADGTSCRAAPVRDSVHCFWHNPLTVEQAQEARRLGGIRRRREGVVAAAYDVGPLDSVAGIRRVLEAAVLDVLPLENSVGRARVLIAASLAAARLLELELASAEIGAARSATGRRATDHDG